MALERRIDVTVRDPKGELLRGARIAFQVDGHPAGGVDHSDGRGDLTLPAGDRSKVSVTVEYAGKTKSAVLALDQTHYTFIFEGVDPMPRQPKRTGMILGTLLVFAVLAVAALVAFRPHPAADPVEAAAEGIAQRCAGGREIRNESLIKAGLSNYLTRVSGAAKVSASEVGSVTSKLRPTGIGADMYKTYTACLKDQTEDYLKLKGVQVESAKPAPVPHTAGGSSTTSSPQAR
ncbi:MAG: hypothetical protein JWL84_13 [Rhodospirillales bacterium]|nr:hypothetical protein [Rhodospirillales bacterium]